MKKILTIILICFSVFLLITLVSAQGEARDATGPVSDEMIAAGGQNGGDLGVPEPTLYQEARQVRTGNYATTDGKQVQFSEKANNRFEFRVGDSKAETNLQIRQETNGEMQVQLSNGRNALVKVMPDTVSEKVLTRLKLKNCNETNNCIIELKEVGKGDQVKLAYEVQIERHSRILGLFQAKMQVRIEVDAETGEIIRVGKPWWAFLATEPEEE